MAYTPCLARHSTVLRPIPRLPPVTIATLLAGIGWFPLRPRHLLWTYGLIMSTAYWRENAETIQFPAYSCPACQRRVRNQCERRPEMPDQLAEALLRYTNRQPGD